MPPFFPRLFNLSVLIFAEVLSWIMKLRSAKCGVPRVSTDNSSTLLLQPKSTQDAHLQRDLQVHPRVYSSPQADHEDASLLRLIMESGVSLESRNKISTEPTKVPRSSQSIRTSKRSAVDADGREMLPDQVPELPQETDHQESSQDVHPWGHFQVHPTNCSSSKSSHQTDAESERMAVYQLLQRICKNLPDRPTAQQKNNLYQLLKYARKRWTHQVRTNRSQQKDQENDVEMIWDSRQELSRRDLQVHPRLRSSPQINLEILSKFRPELRRQVTSETDYPASGTQEVLHEAQEENQVQIERSQQEHQNEYRVYDLSVTTGRKVLVNDRPLKQLDMNVLRPRIRTPPTTPYHFQMPSHNYQQMVSHLAKSSMSGNLDSVYPQDQRNRTASTEHDDVLQGNLGQTESCCTTSEVDGKLVNEQSMPMDPWPRGPQLKWITLEPVRRSMERYLEVWATEPTFVEEVARIADTMEEKDFLS